MLTAQRRDLLLERLRRDGRLVAREIAGELGVTEDMIRRDLRELASAGLVQRVYGGALPVSPAVADYAARTSVAPGGKRHVAASAAALVTPGSVVALDGGTTALAVVDALPRDLRATIVTHSPTIAVALAGHPDIDVEIIGGRLFRHSMVASGATALEAVSRLRVDLFLLGVTGVHAEAGLTTGDRDEAALKRAIAARAGDTYVLASSEKIGAASAFEVLPLAAVSGVVTDADDGPAMAALAAAGVQLIRA
ncbi:DeoR/GlpR family DNA-binding transcription regulator [Agromyces mariniharenae]|uniref:Lactose phosphotransferase system repressor n=1 Tax=Agromyces mariniharenae TaxID=2604423 RepID=A0A5S4VA93_9MICO|nr:DeoR/GlpR family DNA-binding transcription regulator [Agromyces mariniharenae]TYL53530.1 DeoR/GlpR transcriptional regulator [Agromyces mariniharenae]